MVMRYFAIVALKRDWSEGVIALRVKEEDARRSAWQYAAALAGEVIRCRVRAMDLSIEEVKAICYRWGVEDAGKGGPVPHDLPGVYGEEYQRGFASVRPPTGTGQSA